MQGGFLAFGTNIDQLFSPVGFDSAQISALGFLIAVLGIFSAFAAGSLVAKYHKYKLMVLFSTWGTFLFLTIAIFSYLTQNLWFISLVMISAALCLVPIIPVGIDYATELTYPIEETVVTGFLLMNAQAFGFVLANIVLQLA
jgi:FLVCR family feline leukemia virus subgroup C receptor-related protein